jgi:hypothetical protein
MNRIDKLPMIKKNTLLWPVRSSNGEFRGTTNKPLKKYTIVDEHYRKKKNRGVSKVKTHKRRIRRRMMPLKKPQLGMNDDYTYGVIKNQRKEVMGLVSEIRRLKEKVPITISDKQKIERQLQSKIREKYSKEKDIDMLEELQSQINQK